MTSVNGTTKRYAEPRKSFLALYAITFLPAITFGFLISLGTTLNLSPLAGASVNVVFGVIAYGMTYYRFAAIAFGGSTFLMALWVMFRLIS